MSQVEKKIQFIKAWYNDECANLTFGDRLKLAKIWIDICLCDEEYEMAAALKEERELMVQRHIKEKRKKRKFSQRISISVFMIIARIKKWFRNKQ
jgi:cytosine/adenosine deaminase-related metal-dependent hydrolase